MHTVVSFSRRVAERVLSARACTHVGIVNDPRSYRACFGNGELLFNVRALGRDWFDRHPFDGHAGEPSDVMALLVHELGHHYCPDHLDERYHRGLCRIGSHLALLGVNGVLALLLDEARAEAEQRRKAF